MRLKRISIFSSLIVREILSKKNRDNIDVYRMSVLYRMSDTSYGSIRVQVESIELNRKALYRL